MRLYLYLAAALAVVALLGGLYLKGRGDGIESIRVQLEAERAAALAAQLDFERRERELQNELDLVQQNKLAKVRVVTREIIKEVPVYVSPESDAGCTVPSGFVQLHNDAAAGVPPASDTPVVPHDTPSGVALSEVATAVAENYGTCRELREQVIGWQEWYRREKAQWGAK